MMSNELFSELQHELVVLKGVSLGAEKLAESLGGEVAALGTGTDEHEALCATLTMITDKLRALSGRLSDYELTEAKAA